ncbi:MAG: hypothetical protein JWP79_731 [Polaromonas sp.]|jgi:hypothetical protein|nr:hypothetical protein [Polaromonas sp.]MDB5843421.1 hypothetical protein [Polaromonas sp.]MDB5940220.1 hypothetical protein [Polaromonas sp.]
MSIRRALSANAGCGPWVVHSPVTDEVIGKMAVADQEDVDRAVAAAAGVVRDSLVQAMTHGHENHDWSSLDEISFVRAGVTAQQ